MSERIAEPGSIGWRVAVLGAGPAGFYCAQELLKCEQPGIHVDVFDRLPTPHGLVRGGVAPDHQKIKSVSRIYEQISEHPRFRYFGNVSLGEDISRAELRAHYDQVCYAVGASGDKQLNIPGEDLPGVYAATEFVGWYNGHPDFVDHQFPLEKAKTAVVVGNGNVAIDVARILLRKPEQFRETDMPEYAIEALERSAVREVVLLGRRGPAQAAFSAKELKELSELDGVTLTVRRDEATLDALSENWLTSQPKPVQRTVELIKAARFIEDGYPEQGRTLLCRFLVGPKAFLGAERVTAIKLERGELYEDEMGVPRPRGSGRYEEIATELVFKAVGYKGVRIDDLPYDERTGVIPNIDGRVISGESAEVSAGEYVVGWAKRGPTGLIGTNSADARDTVRAMLEDVLESPAIEHPDISTLLHERGVDVTTLADWRRLDAWEREQGAAAGKVRSKSLRIEDMLKVIHQLRD